MELEGTARIDWMPAIAVEDQEVQWSVGNMSRVTELQDAFNNVCA